MTEIEQRAQAIWDSIERADKTRQLTWCPHCRIVSNVWDCGCTLIRGEPVKCHPTTVKCLAIYSGPKDPKLLTVAENSHKRIPDLSKTRIIGSYPIKNREKVDRAVIDFVPAKDKH